MHARHLPISSQLCQRFLAVGLNAGAAGMIAALGLIPGALAADEAAANKNDTRLSGDTSPISYRIFVEPQAEEGKFTGSESITVSVNRPTSQIILNSADIKVEEADCLLQGQSDHIKLKVCYEAKLDRLLLELPQTIKPGNYQIALKFRGTLNDKNKGFFRTSFRDQSGVKRWIAATQMEPTDARRMFPCFDEPQYKATFNISTSIDPSDTAISNAPLSTEKIDAVSKRKIITFEETPKISTYLVALAVGRFVPSKTINACGVPIRVWCTPGKEKLTAFSLNLSAQLLPYYTQYFAINYPAKKLDLVAIPDFSFGSMENLGAAFFREDALLVDESSGSLDAKQQVAINVAHEVAHMWFGDLVTMQWWDDLWLNEAFAEWMSTKAVDRIEPSWHYWNQFASERDQSMLSDSLKATRPIHGDVTKANQIEQMFDEITYEKGASVLRMLERYVTEDNFRNGIRRYLQGHEFANATTEHLWGAIGAESGKDVSGIMHSWIYQEGFPLLTVNSTEQKLSLSQSRFLFKPNQKPDSSAANWQIPVAVRNLDQSLKSTHNILVADKNTEIADADGAPLIVNAGGEGYYRVRYGADNLRKIACGLYKLTALERAAVLSDQFYLAVSGQIPVDDYLEFTQGYDNEKDPAVTSVLCTQLNQINLLIDDSSSASFAQFVCERLGKAKKSFRSTALANDSDLFKRERAEVMLTLGTIGQDKKTIAQARELAKELFASDQDTAIDTELIDPILKIVAYNGDASDYAKIESLRQRAKSPGRQKSALMALALFQGRDLMEKTLKMSLTDRVSKQDGPDLIAAVMETRAGRGVAWEFFRKHITHIGWRFSGHSLYSVVMAMNSLSKGEQLSEVQAFFRKHPVPSESRGINKIIEAIQVRVDFRRRSGTELSAWLHTNTLSPTQISDSHFALSESP